MTIKVLNARIRTSSNSFNFYQTRLKELNERNKIKYERRTMQLSTRRERILNCNKQNYYSMLGEENITLTKNDEKLKKYLYIMNRGKNKLPNNFLQEHPSLMDTIYKFSHSHNMGVIKYLHNLGFIIEKSKHNNIIKLIKEEAS